MKICSNCGRQNAEQAKFCIYCGQKLIGAGQPEPHSVKKRNRLNTKYLLISSLVLAAAAISVGLLLIRPASASSYQEKIAMGDRYYLDEDYEKAEEYYLEAKKIEPKKPEAYQKLCQVYLETDQSEKENEIQKEASDYLTDDDHKLLDLAVEEIRNANGSNSKKESEGDTKNSSANESISETESDQTDRDDTDRSDTDDSGEEEMAIYRAPASDKKAIADLGALDFAPVDVPGYGWVIRNQKGVQFLRPDGKMYPVSKKLISKTDQSESDYTDCILGQKNLDNLLTDAAFEGKAKACGQIYLTSNFSVYTKNGDQLELSVSPKPGASALNLTEETPEKPIFVSEKGDPDWDDRQPVRSMMEDQKYYIYLPDEKKFLGPYTSSQNASYALQLLHDPESGSFWQLSGRQNLLGAFWEKTDEGYRIYSADGKKNLENRKDVLIISPRVIGASDSEKFTLYDSNLKIIYQIEADGGAAPIDGVIPILEGRNWKLVRIDDLKSEDPSVKDSKKDTTSDNRSENTDQKPAITPVEPEVEPIPIPEEPVTEEMNVDQALEIAKAYWNYPDPEEFAIQIDGNGPIEIDGTLYYHFRLRARIEGHLSTQDEVYVNSQTGGAVYTPGS